MALPARRRGRRRAEGLSGGATGLGSKLKPRWDVHSRGDENWLGCASEALSHPYLENGPAPLFDLHYLRISPWLWFSTHHASERWGRPVCAGGRSISPAYPRAVNRFPTWAAVLQQRIEPATHWTSTKRRERRPSPMPLRVVRRQLTEGDLGHGPQRRRRHRRH